MPPENPEPRSDQPDIGEFLLHTCHDLRTALRAVRLHSDSLLRSGELAQLPGLEERLGFIVDGTKKITLLADGISSYSIALQLRRESLQRAPLGALLRAVLAKLDGEISAHQATVTYDQMPTVSGDPDRLMEVFENLILNALRHRGPDSPQIRIAVEPRGEDWLFTVRDNGPGVEASYVESIFKPFIRLRGHGQPGPGLGLAICKIIVEKHGGRIWAESTEGGGTAFLFTLPGS